MNVIVLGGSGYLGYNIVKKLVSKGHGVTCIIRHISSIEKFESLKKVRFISNDLASVELAFRNENFDCVINCVCTYSPNETLYGDMFESNIVFLLSILNLAIKYNIRCFMTMGTSLSSELNVYSFTKAQFSDFGKYLSKKNNINFVELRLELFYGGDYEPSNRFIKNSIVKLKQGETLKLTEGKQKRDIICVEDIVTIISILLENIDSIDNGYSIFPVGTGEQHSIREIIEFMKETLGSDSKLEFGAIPMREGETDTLADVSWYAKIAYQLKYNYFEGLKKECLGK